MAKCNPPAPPNALASVSAASFRGSFLAPESIAAAFGSGLGTQTVAADELPLPTRLAGTGVRVKDSSGVERPAPLFFVSPNQINYQMPLGTAPGAATVTVVPAAGQPVSGAAQVAAIAPGLFAANADGQGAPAGVVLRQKADGRRIFEPLARFAPDLNRFVPAPIKLPFVGPAPDRVFLILFGTGLRAGANVRLLMGVNWFDALYAGPQGSFVGVDQVNVELIRNTLSSTDLNVSVTVNERVTNTVRILITD